MVKGDVGDDMFRFKIGLIKLKIVYNYLCCEELGSHFLEHGL